MIYANGTGESGTIVHAKPTLKLGGGLFKPRPTEGKLWPTGLPKQDKG